MSKARAKQDQQAMRNFVNTDWSPHMANNFQSPIRAKRRARMTEREQTLFSGPGCDGTRAVEVTFDTLKLERFELADVLSSEKRSVEIHTCCQQ